MAAYELELVMPTWEPGKTDVVPRNTRVICRLAPSYDIKIYEEVEASTSPPSDRAIFLHALLEE